MLFKGLHTTLIILLLLSISSYSQNSIIFKGTVKDSKGKSIENANITVQDPSRSTSTNLNGVFSLAFQKELKLHKKIYQ